MRISLIAIIFLLGAIVFATTKGEYNPKETKVAIVPLVNATELKWEDLKKKQVERGNEFLREEFSKRGFQVIDAAEVDKAMDKHNIDMTDEEQQRKDILYTVGREVNADLVVFAIIIESEAKRKKVLDIGFPLAEITADSQPFQSIGDVTNKVLDPVMPAQREGKAKIKLWLLDVKKEKPIINAKKQDGKSKGGYFAFLDKNSKHQIAAVANALKNILKDFWKPYPELKEKK